MRNKMLLLTVQNEVFLCKGSDAYVTHYPCIICCRLLLASGVKNIYYIDDYKNDELVKTFCDELKVNIKKMQVTNSN